MLAGSSVKMHDFPFSEKNDAGERLFSWPSPLLSQFVDWLARGSLLLPMLSWFRYTKLFSAVTLAAPLRSLSSSFSSHTGGSSCPYALLDSRWSSLLEESSNTKGSRSRRDRITVGGTLDAHENKHVWSPARYT